MTNGAADVTRGEFGMLVSRMDSVERRIESMDTHGTRDAVGLAAQIVELTKDFTRLEGAVSRHETRHEEERKERSRNRKWMITTCIAVLVMLTTVLSVVIAILAHVHK